MTLIGLQLKFGDCICEKEGECEKIKNVEKNRQCQKNQDRVFFLTVEQNPYMEAFKICFLRSPCGDFPLALKKVPNLDSFVAKICLYSTA